jgi:hypothetical protein
VLKITLGLSNFIGRGVEQDKNYFVLVVKKKKLMQGCCMSFTFYLFIYACFAISAEIIEEIVIW